MRNVPQLRFAGFEGEWEERNIKELSNKVTGGGTPSTKIEEYWNGNIPWIQTSDINDDYIKIKKYNKYISSEAIDNSAAKLINSNSISIVTRVGVGKVVKVDHELATSQDFTNLSELNSEITFTTYLLKKTMEKLSFILQGTSIKGITQKELLLTNIKLPISNVEQDKIGDLFKKIDALIEKQEGKVSKMEDFKKSMLQKMFPKKGELVPEFRFDGFDGEWEKKKISDIGKISAGGDVDKKKISNKGRYPVIANGDSNNGIIGYYEDHYKISEPAVTISARGNIGTAVARNYPFTPVIRVLTLTSDNNIYFMSEAINRLRIFNESSGVPQLTSPQFGGYNIFMTKLSEQQKIGQFFKNLDIQIETEEKLLESYKQMKKSLLQKMFV